MLAMNSYPRRWIDACRSRTDAQVRAFRRVAAASSRAAGKGAGPVRALEEFEAAFFNNLVIVPDAYFGHRTRGIEKKDGNPLNEVRVLANSMMQNDGVMLADCTIRMSPLTSVLGYAVGDTIRVRTDGFARIAEAFFVEVEKRFAK
jgi:hypothetical protein